MFTELHIYFQLELLSKIHGHCSSVTNQAMKVTGNKHVNRKQATGLQRWLTKMILRNVFNKVTPTSQYLRELKLRKAA